MLCSAKLHHVRLCRVGGLVRLVATLALPVLQLACPHIEKATCGDGIREAWEKCDDGNGNSNNWSASRHCSADCKGYAPYCGDQQVDSTDRREWCDDGNRVDGDGCDNDCRPSPVLCATGEAEPATAIRISRVEYFQGIGIPLMNDGKTVTTRAAPLVAGRAGLLRVFADPTDTWIPHDVLARVSLNTAGTPLELWQQVESPSEIGDLLSTLNILVPGAALTPLTQISVELLECPGNAAPIGEVQGTRWPDTGAMSLNAQDVGSLRVMLVPMRYSYDGSQRVPDVSDAVVRSLKSAMLGQYPVSAVEVSVHEVVNYAGQVTPTNGLGDLLNALNEIRYNEVLAQSKSNPDAADVFYYGLIQPTESFRIFCTNSCAAGTAFVTNAGDEFLRTGVGVTFPDDVGVQTFVHEIGHTLGRDHAPCGNLTDADAAYPHPDGRLGSWGIDPTNHLIDPAGNTRDFMSYCTPQWVSDYTYSHLAERMRYINGFSTTANSYVRTAARTIGAEATWRMWTVAANGQARGGYTMQLQDTPGGEATVGTVLGSSDEPLGEILAVQLRHGEPQGDTHWLVEEPTQAGASRIRVGSWMADL